MGALRNRFMAVLPEKANVMGSDNTEMSALLSDSTRRWALSSDLEC